MEGLYFPEFGDKNQDSSWNTDIFLRPHEAFDFCRSKAGESYYWNSLSSKLPGGKYQTIRLLKELASKLDDPHCLDVNPETEVVSFVERVGVDSFDMKRVESYRSSALVFSACKITDIWRYMLRFEAGFSVDAVFEEQGIDDIFILRSISDQIFVWSRSQD